MCFLPKQHVRHQVTRYQWRVLFAAALLSLGSSQANFANEPCDILTTKVRELKGEGRKAQLEKLASICLLGPWNGELRYFFPGAEYPYDHFCCPKAALEFEATADGIRALLKEVESPLALEFVCAPGGEQYTCKGVGSQYARCKLTAEPAKAERYSKLSLECTDESAHITLMVYVKRGGTN